MFRTCSHGELAPSDLLLDSSLENQSNPASLDLFNAQYNSQIIQSLSTSNGPNLVTNPEYGVRSNPPYACADLHRLKVISSFSSLVEVSPKSHRPSYWPSFSSTATFGRQQRQSPTIRVSCYVALAYGVNCLSRMIGGASRDPCSWLDLWGCQLH